MVHKSFAIAAAAVMLAVPQVHAASVSYFLDQSNTTPPFSDGNNYLTVKIDDEGGNGTNGGDSLITFTVTPIASQFTAGPNFGIQGFQFNITGNPYPNPLPDSPDPAWLLPANWDAKVAPPPNVADGFGAFDVDVSNTGSDRKDPLVFSIDVGGDDINSYFAPSTGTAGEGNAWFTAHVAGFTTSDPLVTSAWFGGGNGAGTPPLAVPEPISVALVGSALLGLVAIRRQMAS
jgi:hypothetical protein